MVGDITMSNGNLAGLKEYAGDLFVNDDSKVIEPDIFTSNGVIHVVDSLIIPPWPRADEEAATTTDANIYRFADAPNFVDTGDASLVRTNDNVTTQVSLGGVEPGMWTLWWIVWNTPEGCFEPFACNEPDLFNPNSGLAVGYASGAVVGADGNLHMEAELAEGVTLREFAYPEYQAIGLELNNDTMIDSRHAEVHLEIRYHGPHIPEQEDAGTQTFNGACVYESPLNPEITSWGTPGPNTCISTHFTVFPSEHG
jgi:hypothetical protein